MRACMGISSMHDGGMFSSSLSLAAGNGGGFVICGSRNYDTSTWIHKRYQTLHASY